MLDSIRREAAARDEGQNVGGDRLLLAEGLNDKRATRLPFRVRLRRPASFDSTALSKPNPLDLSIRILSDVLRIDFIECRAAQEFQLPLV